MIQNPETKHKQTGTTATGDPEVVDSRDDDETRPSRLARLRNKLNKRHQRHRPHQIFWPWGMLSARGGNGDLRDYIKSKDNQKRCFAMIQHDAGGSGEKEKKMLTVESCIDGTPALLLLN